MWTDHMKKNLYQFSGWGGVVLILVAYFLVSFSLVSVRSVLYQGLNVVGSAGLTVEALSKRDQPLAWLNGIWALIAVVAIVQVIVPLLR